MQFANFETEISRTILHRVKNFYEGVAFIEIILNMDNPNDECGGAINDVCEIITKIIIIEHLLKHDLVEDAIDETKFGMNGKPAFVAGTYDDTKRINALLEKNVGPGNYKYISPFKLK